MPVCYLQCRSPPVSPGRGRGFFFSIRRRDVTSCIECVQHTEGVIKSDRAGQFQGNQRDPTDRNRDSVCQPRRLCDRGILADIGPLDEQPACRWPSQHAAERAAKPERMHPRRGLRPLDGLRRRNVTPRGWLAPFSDQPFLPPAASCRRNRKTAFSPAIREFVRG